MKRHFTMCLCVAVLLSMGAVAQQNVTVEGAEGATLRKIAGTETLVTVVLKPSGARDANLRVVELLPETFAVLTSQNVRYAYRYDAVERVIVQGGRVQAERFTLAESRALSNEQQAVVDRALAQARQQFNNSNRDQGMKMGAAAVLAAANEPDALEYLRSLANSNDLRTRFEAASALYLVGEDPSPDLLDEGLASSSRSIRAQAAKLSGLVGYEGATVDLSTMLQDRRTDACAPAAKALARLGDRSIIPALLNMLSELDPEKGAAAIFALSELGGPDVAEQMRLRVVNAEGLVWFRMVTVLHNLCDPMGRELLVRAFNEVPTVKMDAARMLLDYGDWDAKQYLQERMDRREDATLANLTARTRNAAALYAAGDFAAKVMLQQMGQAELPAIRSLLTNIIVEVGDRGLFTVLQPLIEDQAPAVSMSAVTASAALAYPDYRERLLGYWEIGEQCPKDSI